MEQAEIIDFMREAIWLMIKLSAPIMLIGLTVGVIIALVQALTQIQEMTLSFVPKMLAIFVSIFLFFPAMAAALQAFMEMIADKIISLG
ncbi:MAG: flagellar biosynthetic protein FliQ [Alphaproteobacteria bacterium]|nr:MAG: flagellar biosynthetic protein FliQ [Alphaproteobacteria bacterium]